MGIVLAILACMYCYSRNSSSCTSECDDENSTVSIVETQHSVNRARELYPYDIRQHDSQTFESL